MTVADSIPALGLKNLALTAYQKQEEYLAAERARANENSRKERVAELRNTLCNCLKLTEEQADSIVPIDSQGEECMIDGFYFRPTMKPSGRTFLTVLLVDGEYETPEWHEFYNLEGFGALLDYPRFAVNPAEVVTLECVEHDEGTKPENVRMVRNEALRWMDLDEKHVWQIVEEGA